jgi:microcompartment protein CcmL/EutN
MRLYPAIAILEISSIPTGISTADSMVKNSPITILKSGTVHNGKFVIFIGGSVASVEESYNNGLAATRGLLIDHIYLPFIHSQVHDSILGERRKCIGEAMGIIETSTISSAVHAADSALKGTNIQLIELRSADDIGGKGIAIYSGATEEVETAVEISKNTVADSGNWLSDIVIPRIASEMKDQVEHSTTFSNNSVMNLKGGEL